MKVTWVSTENNTTSIFVAGRLYTANHNNSIVLCIKTGENLIGIRIAGKMVIKKPDTFGEFSNCWASNMFKPFKGSVILTEE